MKKTTLFLATLLATAFLALGLNAKTLVYCSEGSPSGFDPAIFTDGTTMDASAMQLYNKLVEFKPGTTNIVPALATSWKISDDGLTYTFNLRKGVKFHSNKNFTPTRDFNADDVLFSFNRQFDKNHPFHSFDGISFEYWGAMDMSAAIKSISKTDDYTIVIKLKAPEAPMIANLAMAFTSILSKEYADKLEAQGNKGGLNTDPIGTGPFKLVQYRKDALIRYEANKDFFRGKAAIDKLIFAITSDNSVAYQKLKAGECHVMAYPNPADIESMKDDKDITVLEQAGLNVGYLAFNVNKPPFDNKLVRQALNLAIDKQAIIDVVFQGVGIIAKNPIPPTIWSYNDAVVDYPYDPVKAKAMLKQAGVTDLKTNIWAMPVQRPYNPNARRMAELIQSDWKKVGVEAEIISMEWGEYLKKSKEGAHETILLGWTGDNGDPDNFLYVLLSCAGAKSGANRAGWCNKEFDDLLLQAKKISDVEKRTQLYKKAQLIFKEEAPWVTIAHSVVFKPTRKEVKGFKVHPFGSHIFYGVDID